MPEQNTPQRNRMESWGFVRDINTDDRTVEVVVSTEDVARDGMVIRADGWVLDNYNRNPVVLWAHNDREPPIARTVESRVVNRALVQTHQFNANSERSMEMFAMVRDGFVNATSVRWDPLEASFEMVDGEEVLVFRRQELLETSYVSIPADPGALVIRADGQPVDIDTYRPKPGPSPAEERSRSMERIAAALERGLATLKGEDDAA